MSEKSIRVRLDGRGEFADLSKDFDADLVVAYMLSFEKDNVGADVAMVGRHDIGNKEFAAQLGRITAQMLGQSFGEFDSAVECWDAFREAWTDEMNLVATKHIKEGSEKLKAMLEKEVGDGDTV